MEEELNGAIAINTPTRIRCPSSVAAALPKASEIFGTFWSYAGLYSLCSSYSTERQRGSGAERGRGWLWRFYSANCLICLSWHLMLFPESSLFIIPNGLGYFWVVMTIDDSDWILIEIVIFLSDSSMPISSLSISSARLFQLVISSVRDCRPL